MSCWQFIDQERSSYPVELRCRTLAVSFARYYAWRKQQSSPAQPAAADWEEALKETFGQLSAAMAPAGCGSSYRPRATGWDPAYQHGCLRS